MYTLKTTVNNIFAEYGNEYLKKYPTSDHDKKIIRAISICRTEELGGHMDTCINCGHTVIMYNSCRNRHCPQCQFMKKEKWIMKKKNEILPFQYFHVVFTLPAELNGIIYQNQKILYKLLFKKVKETLLTIAEEKKYLGAKIGFFGILHTWGQKLNLHPHIHCVVPGGGYSTDKKKWIKCSKDYFVKIDILMQRFRSLFLVGLKKLNLNNKLNLSRLIYADKKKFQNLIDKLFEKKWVVYSKASFKNSDSVIEYLGRYTHKIAISNYRIIGIENDIVSFVYKDYKDNNKKKIQKVNVLKFIRLFLLHVVPYRFVRIRYFGLLSNRTKKETIEKCYDFFNLKIKKNTKEESWEDIYFRVTGNNVRICSVCGSNKIQRLEIIRGKSFF